MEGSLVGPYLSYPLRQNVRMKLNLLDWMKQENGETLAIFGTARLVKMRTGKIKLLGGSADDQIAAKEWASLFLHEATI